MSQIPPPIPPQPPVPPGSGSGGDTLPDLLPPTMPGPLGGNLPMHRASTVLGLGIASLGVIVLDVLGFIHPMCCCGATLISIGLAIPTLVMANADLAAMNAGRMDPSGRSHTSSGRICAIIALVVGAIAIIVSIIAALAGIAIFGAMAAAGNRP